MISSAARWIPRLLLAAVAVLTAGLWWHCEHDAAVRFLPQAPPAAWIVYPNPPDISAHPVPKPGDESAGIFRRSFAIEQVPAEAHLQVRALENFAIRLNGVPVPAPVKSGRIWKERHEFSIGPLLRHGTNQIEITVTNRAGPPLLWLTLTAGEQKILSDTSWEASYADAVWQPAHLAVSPREFRPGNPMHTNENLASSLRRRAWTHVKLLLFAISFVAMASYGVAERKDLFTASEMVRLTLGGLVLLWTVLFINNITQVSPTTGFDTRHHLGYIKFIQDQHQLPKSEAGWEAHQPPLYYLFSAFLLEVVGLQAASPDGVLALRALSMLYGIGQIFLVFASLRLLFPNELRRPLIGTAMAAFLPAHLYHAHYITNETFLALLASGTFYLCLRILRDERSDWRLCLGLGGCLGAALLTKVSALIVAVAVFAALATKLSQERAKWKDWLGTAGVATGACLLVCGWYYWQLWQAGGPWNDPRWAYGSGWWQEDGYRTGNYYFRFGESLVRPFYSGFRSFWDGIYSTLWGDGLCGGLVSVDFHPPWDQQLLSIGYVLALLPTFAVITGFVSVFWHWFRRPSAEWTLLLGATMLFALALIYFSLMAPGTSQARASFGLMLLVPFCALFARGMDRLASMQRWVGVALVILVVWCAVNSFCAHWIPRSSAQPLLFRAQLAFQMSHFAEAARAAEEGLRRDPSISQLRSLLSDSWNQIGKTNEATTLVEKAVLNFPTDPWAHLDAGFALAQAGRLDEAVSHTRRALELAPDHPMAARELVLLLSRQQRLDEAVLACREALRLRPHDADLRAWLKQLRDGNSPVNEQRH